MYCYDYSSEIARIAYKNKMIVLSDDSDFYVFDVPAVINVSFIFNNYRSYLIYGRNISRVPRGVYVYNRQKLLSNFDLSPDEFVCCCMIAGNDFVSRIEQAKELNLNYIGAIISFVKQRHLTSKQKCAEFYHSLNPEVSVEEVESILASHSVVLRSS